MQDKTIKTSKLKVCLVVTKGTPFGGAQKYVYELATRLRGENCEPWVICGVGDALPEKLRAEDIRVRELPHLARNIGFASEIKSSWNMLRLLNEDKPHVLHLNSPKAAGFGAVAGRIIGVRKIIYTVHGFAFNEDRSLPGKLLIGFFSWLTIMLSHKTIVIAERERRQAMAMPFVKNKIVLIHNGIEQILFEEKTTARAELLSLAQKESVGNALWLGTLAELHKNKGLGYLIYAVSKLTSPFVLFILGEGEQRKYLEELIYKYNLQDRVFLVGFVKHADRYLRAFDMFMLPSIKEGLPYSILEAGQAKLPTIASNVGGVSDIIENGVNGILITKGRSGEITRAIEHLVENPALQKQFGEKIREKVEREFSLDQMLERTLELYNS